MAMTQDTAINTLKNFFGESHGDYISVEEIYANVGRLSYPLDKNRDYFYTKTSAMRHYDLFTKIRKTIDHKQQVVGIKLTASGHRAVHGDVPSPQQVLPSGGGKNHAVTFESIRDDVKTLREQFPALEINLSVTLRENEGTG